jgi:hypothetical protein
MSCVGFEKKKNMITSQNVKQNENVTIGNYTFGVVQIFTYLGSSLSSQASKKRILIASKCFYGLKNQLKSHVLSCKRKIIFYKTLIRPVLSHASETWVLSTTDEKALAM